MEETKLNFDAPLLSVRRISVASAGQNKKKTEFSQLRRSNTHIFSKSEFCFDEVTKPAAVPFQWEQKPGRPKHGNGHEPQQPEITSTATPRLPPGRSSFSDQNGLMFRLDCKNLDDSAVELESLKEGVKDREATSINDDDDDDDYVVNSDVFDDMSPIDSISLKDCSVSAVSGSDGAEVNSSGTFSADPLTRDFMMSRFLPAARAVALELPQYSSKKQLEQQRQAKKLKCNDPTMASVREQSENGETVGEDDECEDRGDDSGTRSGSSPGLCFKDSLCRLYPLPLMKMRTLSLLSSPHSNVERPDTATNIGCQEQNIKDDAWKHKLEVRMESLKLREVDSKRVDEPKQNLSLPESSSLSSSSRHSKGPSPYRNEALQSPCITAFHKVSAELENPKSKMSKRHSKQSSDFRKVLSRSESMTETTENTLRSDAEDASNDGENSSEIHAEGSVNQDLKRQGIFSGGCLSESESVDMHLSFASGTSHPEGQVSVMEGSTIYFELDRGSKSFTGSTMAADRNQPTQTDCQTVKRGDPGNVHVGSAHQSLLPPPLPKSPSHSWLWRNLPSISTRRYSTGSNFSNRTHGRRKVPKASHTSTKWETIVRTSNLHHDHESFPEE